MTVRKHEIGKQKSYQKRRNEADRQGNVGVSEKRFVFARFAFFGVKTTHCDVNGHAKNHGEHGKKNVVPDACGALARFFGFILLDFQNGRAGRSRFDSLNGNVVEHSHAGSFRRFTAQTKHQICGFAVGHFEINFVSVPLVVPASDADERTVNVGAEPYGHSVFFGRSYRCDFYVDRQTIYGGIVDRNRLIHVGVIRLGGRDFAHVFVSAVGGFAESNLLNRCGRIFALPVVFRYARFERAVLNQFAFLAIHDVFVASGKRNDHARYHQHQQNSGKFFHFRYLLISLTLAALPLRSRR